MTRKRLLHLASCSFFPGLVLLVAACSGTQDNDVEDPTSEFQTTGSDDSVSPTDETNTDGPEVAPEKGGAGQLRLKLLASGSPVKGKVRIVTAEVEPQLIDEGDASKTYDLQAGRYDIEIVMEDTLDRPEKRLRDVQIKAGELTERQIEFPVGTINLRPMRSKAMVKSSVRWRYNGGGDWFEGTSQTGEDLMLSCGRYDAEIRVGNADITISDIQVYEGRTTVSPPVSMTSNRGR